MPVSTPSAFGSRVAACSTTTTCARSTSVLIRLTTIWWRPYMVARSASMPSKRRSASKPWPSDPVMQRALMLGSIRRHAAWRLSDRLEPMGSAVRTPSATPETADYPRVLVRNAALERARRRDASSRLARHASYRWTAGGAPTATATTCAGRLARWATRASETPSAALALRASVLGSIRERAGHFPRSVRRVRTCVVPISARSADRRSSARWVAPAHPASTIRDVLGTTSVTCRRARATPFPRLVSHVSPDARGCRGATTARHRRAVRRHCHSRARAGPTTSAAANSARKGLCSTSA